MKSFRSLLLLIVVVVIGVGFYRGWFAVSGGREAVSHKVDLNLTVDPDKAQADAEIVKDKVLQ